MIEFEIRVGGFSQIRRKIRPRTEVRLKPALATVSLSNEGPEARLELKLVLQD